MSAIDPNIVIHEIKTYPDAKPIRQCLCPVHPRKATTIKIEFEKLLKVIFIYLVALIDSFFNLVPIDKKQGTIHVCVDYRDINKACPKDNFPTPFVVQIVDDCVGREIFSLMDGFSRYNQINIVPEDQHKTAFICPWGISPIRNFLSISRTLAQLFSALCLMPSMISSTSCSHILMTYPLIPCTGSIIQSTSEPFSSAVGFIIYA
jgi:hypothetical protein